MKPTGVLHRNWTSTATLPSDRVRSATAGTADFVETLASERRIEAVGVTGQAVGSMSDLDWFVELSSDRIYPHLHDENEAAGQAVALLRQAIDDARSALDAFENADLRTVATQLGLVAANTARAHSCAEFNRSFGSVIGFIRRAALVANAGELSRSALNALLHALNQLVAQPTLDLMDAAELAEKLSAEGWRGEHTAVEALVQLLLRDSEIDETAQADLFQPTRATSAEGTA
jgi:hypothetical protein